jgi:hypothetical protein
VRGAFTTVRGRGNRHYRKAGARFVGPTDGFDVLGAQWYDRGLR